MYSQFEEIISGVLQGSILGPSLFNVYICNLFFEGEVLDIASYAEDETPFTWSSETNPLTASVALI